MTHHSKTPAQLYTEFVTSYPKEPKGEYIHHYWKQCLELYYQHGWNLMKNPYRQKTADPWIEKYQSNWPQEHILKTQAEQWTINGGKTGNLSVILGPSKLVSLDWDNAQLPVQLVRLQYRTLTMKTARGYQFLLQEDPATDNSDPDDLEHLRTAYQDYTDDQDKPLFQILKGIHYTLLPMSITCSKDHAIHGQGPRDHKGHPGPDQPCLDGHPHDYRVREWINMYKPVLAMRHALRFLL